MDEMQELRSWKKELSDQHDTSPIVSVMEDDSSYENVLLESRLFRQEMEGHSV